MAFSYIFSPVKTVTRLTDMLARMTAGSHIMADPLKTTYYKPSILVTSYTFGNL